MVVMTEPSSVIQLVQSRGSNEERGKRHVLSQVLLPVHRGRRSPLLQRADVRYQRVDGGRVQLLLVPFHLGVALLGAVLDDALDLRVGLALLPARRAHVFDVHLLALIGLALAVGAVAGGALRLEVAGGLGIGLGTRRRRTSRPARAVSASAWNRSPS